VNTWFVALNGQQAGPFTIDQLRGMAAAGTLQPDTLVWAEGMAGWAPANTTPLAQAMAAAVAPPPPPAGFAAPAAYAPAQPGAPTYTPYPVGVAPGGGGAAPPRSLVEAIQVCLSKYVDFKGRASRSEYWWFFLFVMLASIAVSIPLAFVSETASTVAQIVVSLAFILPGLAAAVRRLHDTDRSGWWYLIGLVPLIGIIVLIVFLCQKGTPGPNRFG
jgi:uncharacterized membrane protein YhaH (DUF805 family)